LGTSKRKDKDEVYGRKLHKLGLKIGGGGGATRSPGLSEKLKHSWTMNGKRKKLMPKATTTEKVGGGGGVHPSHVQLKGID